ncbi:MAG TPA: NAD(P)/FAD-dependent oxidoreductase [Candidatus Sulfopaludibacter sp.]|nr:NAD(P)/FAD-dependent oxidoreductase [Candidatus Sulfopaludibacter sp.]
MNIKTVVILGGGPAACTLAVLLARKGVRAAIFHVPKQATLIVGESTVPAIVPILRLLGVEDEVRSYSEFKPGATVNMSPTQNFYFHFGDVYSGLPRYAYNVPRDKFDATLLNAARKAGVKIIEAAAKVEKIPGTDKVKLSDESLATTENHFPGQPDLIVDATGRLRYLPKLLGIAGREGGRKDTALFAHVDQTKLDFKGHVHSTRLDHGWSWRIPLPGRVSVGIVIPSEHLPRFGATKEERYDNLLKQDSVLSKVTQGSKRLTPVMEHANYQLVSERIVGDNWALVGDTAGFIDPVFSSGLLIGMRGAVLLAKTIRRSAPRDFQRYQQEIMRHLEVWHGIVDSYYDGRLFNAAVVGERLKKKYPLIFKLMPYFENNIFRIFTGAASNSPFHVGMMRRFVTWSAGQEDHTAMRIY